MFAGRFCRSRARLAPRAATAATAELAPRGPRRTPSASARPGRRRSSASGLLLSRSKRYAARIVALGERRRIAACAVRDHPGERRRARSAAACRTASAAATRARSASSSSRSPRPTTSTRSGRSRARAQHGELPEAARERRRRRARRRARPGSSSPSKSPTQTSRALGAALRSAVERDLQGRREYRSGPVRSGDSPASAAAHRSLRRPVRMPKSVILATARTPFGKMGGALCLARRHRPRRPRDRRRPRALRRRARAGRAGRLRPGPAGRPGPDPLAPGPDQGRDPEGGSLRDDQQGLRLRHALGRAARPGDPRRRRRGRRRRRHGVDVERPLPAARRPLRLPDGRRQGARRDDPRRPHQPLHRQADDQRGERGRQRARDHPSRHGPLRGPLAPARRARRPTRAVLADEIVAVTVKTGSRRRWSRPTRRSAPTPPRRRSPGCGRSAATTPPTPPATRPASTTAPRRSSSPPTSGPRPTARRRSARSSATAMVADDFPYLARTPAKAALQALEKPGKTPEDVDLWEINEAFASVALNSIRMLGIDEDKVNVNGGAIALGHPIGASGGRIIGALVHELQPPRRRPRLRRDLLRRRPGRRDPDRGLAADRAGRGSRPWRRTCRPRRRAFAAPTALLARRPRTISQHAAAAARQRGRASIGLIDDDSTESDGPRHARSVGERAPVPTSDDDGHVDDRACECEDSRPVSRARRRT